MLLHCFEYFVCFLLLLISNTVATPLRPDLILACPGPPQDLTKLYTRLELPPYGYSVLEFCALQRGFSSDASIGCDCNQGHVRCQNSRPINIAFRQIYPKGADFCKTSCLCLTNTRRPLNPVVEIIEEEAEISTTKGYNERSKLKHQYCQMKDNCSGKRCRFEHSNKVEPLRRFTFDPSYDQLSLGGVCG